MSSASWSTSRRWTALTPQPQYRNASSSTPRQVSTGSTLQQPIELPDSDSSGSEGRLQSPTVDRPAARSCAGASNAPMASRELPLALHRGHENSSEEKITTVEKPSAKRKQLDVEENLWPEADNFEGAKKHRGARGKETSSPPSESSMDPIDFLPRELAKASPTNKAEPWHVFGRRMNLFGGTSMKTTGAKSSFSLPVDKASRRKIALDLELVTVGEKHAFPEKCRPQITFQLGQRHFAVEWLDPHSEEQKSINVQTTDLRDFECQREPQPKHMLCVFHPESGTQTSRNLSTAVPHFDAKSYDSWLFVQARPHEKNNWSTFATWLKSSGPFKLGAWVPPPAAATLRERYATKALRRLEIIQAGLREKRKSVLPHSPSSALRRVLPASPTDARTSKASLMRKRQSFGPTMTSIMLEPECCVTTIPTRRASSPSVCSSAQDQLVRPVARPVKSAQLNPGRPLQIPQSDLAQVLFKAHPSAALRRTMTSRRAAQTSGLPLSEKQPSESIAARSRPRYEDSLKLRYPLEGPGSVSIFESDYDRLFEGEFLNDTIIEFGFKYHLQNLRQRDPLLFDSVYVYSSFFYRQIHQSKKKPDECYAQVRKWTAKTDIFAKDYLVIPINENLHWYLAIVLNPGKALLAKSDSKEATPSSTSDACSIATRSQANNSAARTPVRRNKQIVESESKATGSPALVLPSSSILQQTTGASHDVAAHGQDSAIDRNFQRSYSQLSICDKPFSNSPRITDEGACLPTRIGELELPAPMNLDMRDSTANLLDQAFHRYVSNAEISASIKPPVLSSPDNFSSPGLLGSEADGTILISDSDPCSNISNAGRGKIIGGGGFGPSFRSPPHGPAQPARKRPAAIVPGESMQKRTSNSPPQNVTDHTISSRPRPRPLASSTTRQSAKGGETSLTRTPENLHAPRNTTLEEPARKPSIPSMLHHEFVGYQSGSSAVNSESTSCDAPRILQHSPSHSKSRRSDDAIERDRDYLREELVVLTFDSLGSKHPSVNTAINHYLRNEAWDKRRIRIRPEARYIHVPVPEQNNFADCGLFILLCMFAGGGNDATVPFVLLTYLHPTHLFTQILNGFFEILDVSKRKSFHSGMLKASFGELRRLKVPGCNGGLSSGNWQ